MTQYDDGPKPIRPRDEFDGMLANMPEIGALMPGLPDHLRRFPIAPVPDAEDFLYWSKEKFGIAPFITVTHVTHRLPVGGDLRDDDAGRVFEPLPRRVGGAGDRDRRAGGARTRSISSTTTGRAPTRSRAASADCGDRSTERRARGGLEESLKAIKMQLEKG